VAIKGWGELCWPTGLSGSRSSIITPPLISLVSLSKFLYVSELSLLLCKTGHWRCWQQMAMRMRQIRVKRQALRMLPFVFFMCRSDLTTLWKSPVGYYTKWWIQGILASSSWGLWRLQTLAHSFIHLFTQQIDTEFWQHVRQVNKYKWTGLPKLYSCRRALALAASLDTMLLGRWGWAGSRLY
jgi:hypothetical protein